MHSLNLPRKPVVVMICVGVAALHLVTGPTYNGLLRPFVTGHLIDLLLPFSSVLLLGVDPARTPWLRSSIRRALLVFILGAVVECCQYFGVHFFGRTFDPLDLLMYATGVTVAVGFERVVFPPPPKRTA